MKKSTFAIVFILLIVICAPVMADKATRILTAFKENVPSGANAQKTVEFSILDASETEIVEDREVNIPEEFRKTAYNAFSWVLHGNVFRNVVLTLQFYPMKNNNVKPSESSKTTVIPYKVELTHETTRIGNSAISSYNRALTAAQKENLQQGSSVAFTYYNNGEPTNYEMYYADHYQLTYPSSANATSATVNDSANPVSITLTYDFSTNTVVVPAFPSGADVCNFWNRYGKATVTLQNIDASTEGNYASGNYEAPVRIIIQPGN